MPVATCPNTVPVLFPFTGEPNTRSTDKHETINPTNNPSFSTPVVTCDFTTSYQNEYSNSSQFNQSVSQHQSQRLKPTSTLSSFLPSIHSNMNYSSAPSFTNISYGSREPLNDLKGSYLAETRGSSDYMRGEFNQLAESLNFFSNPLSYDTIAGDGFTNWNPETMDTDSELKPRVDFRALTLGASDMCVRHPCGPNDCRGVTNPPADHLVYATPGRQLNVLGRNQDNNQFDLIPHRDQPPPPLFEVNGYANISRRGYDSKILFNGISPNALGNNLATNGLRSTSDPNANSSLPQGRSVPPSLNSTKSLAVSANDLSVANSIMMTPDSSTAGFLTNKFTTSSDDGEVSPTPTTESSCPRTPGRARKTAPTLATGRRNLKDEPVDPDEADRRMKRRERNRKSAQKCRERKVQRTQELQAQVECLQMEINRLTRERDNLRNEARQFVNLLQIHCPGVSIPHMSCLSDLQEHLGSPRDNFSSLLAANTLSKTDTTRDNLHNGWRMRSGLKPTIGAEPLVSSNQDGPFSTITSLTGFPSHAATLRPKSLFPFPSSGGTNGVTDQTELAMAAISGVSVGLNGINSQSQSDSGLVSSVRSSQDPAPSSSSSSSSSGYELAFPNIGTPVAPNSLLTDHLEDEVESVACNQSTNSLADHPSACQQNGQTSAPNQHILLKSETSASVKCESWDSSALSGQRQYIATESLPNTNPETLSPMSPPTRTIYPGSTETVGPSRS